MINILNLSTFGPLALDVGLYNDHLLSPPQGSASLLPGLWGIGPSGLDVAVYDDRLLRYPRAPLRYSLGCGESALRSSMLRCVMIDFIFSQGLRFASLWALSLPLCGFVAVRNLFEDVDQLRGVMLQW